MAVIGKDSKQPHEILDWDVDWGEWMPRGDSINAVDTDVRVLSGTTDNPITIDRVENTTTVSKVWLRGGDSGSRYRIQLRCETLFGRTKETEFDISVKEV